MRSVSVARAVGMFLDSQRATVAPSTWELYRHYLSRFARERPQMQLADITPADVTRWSARYHPVGCVQRLLAWATSEARLLAFNPLAGMRRVRNGHRRRILSPAELARAKRNASPAFRAFMLAMIESIARPREVRELRWGDIRTSGSPSWSLAELLAGRCFFSLARFKGQALRRDRGVTRFIPISPRLGRLLYRLFKEDIPRNVPIFLNGRGRPWTVNAVRCQFRRLRVRAGLDVDAAGERVVAYTLRHTSATDAVGAGLKAFTLAELMGHSDIRMTQRYVHLRPDHLIAAANQLYEWKQGQRRKNDRLGLRRTRPD